ncbi:PREDICTED: uncharacterized protein LOC109467025 [Branchiostoma belcheri]|uniref:Uncharacterized protein LOC109467025 n=1 Tax=Branchiostoma belcheri TaxID=7741 RepID=A0A6P4Y7R5_BRABE|nr:PREDICTED: uncharacterized protein LOC109467025 [Branchiostoma belcheri]
MSNKARRMLVLLLIILKEAGLTAACSSSCSSNCYCASRGLSSVPQDLPTNITRLSLGRNALTTLSQSDFSHNTNPRGTNSGLDQISLNEVTTNADSEISRRSETPHLSREDSQHIYNLPTDEDPDTAEYNTIDDIDQSESPHQGEGKRLSLDSFGYLVLPPSLPPRPENQTDPQAAAQIESVDAAACTTSVAGPSQRSDSGQIQHLGSFSDGYEVPSPSLYTGKGPQSHKYVNSKMTAAAKDAAAGPKVIMYENDDEIESAKECSQSHKYVNSHVAAAAKDAAAGPQDVVYDNENDDEIESAKEDPQSHKYVNSHVAAAAKDANATAGLQHMVYDNDDEVEHAKGTK